MGHSVVVLTSAVVGYLHKTAANPALNVQRIFEPIFEYEAGLNERNGHDPLWQRRRKQAFGGVIVSNAMALARFLDEYRPDVLIELSSALREGLCFSD